MNDHQILDSTKDLDDLSLEDLVSLRQKLMSEKQEAPGHLDESDISTAILMSLFHDEQDEANELANKVHKNLDANVMYDRLSHEGLICVAGRCISNKRRMQFSDQNVMGLNAGNTGRGRARGRGRGRGQAPPRRQPPSARQPPSSRRMPRHNGISEEDLQNSAFDEEWPDDEMPLLEEQFEDHQPEMSHIAPEIKDLASSRAGDIVTQTTVIPKEMSKNDSVLGGLRKPYSFNTNDTQSRDRNNLELPQTNEDQIVNVHQTDSARPFSERPFSRSSQKSPDFAYNSHTKKAPLKEWEYEFPSLLCHEGDCSVGLTEDGVACVWNQCVSTRGEQMTVELCNGGNCWDTTENFLCVDGVCHLLKGEFVGYRGVPCADANCGSETGVSICYIEKCTFTSQYGLAFGQGIVEINGIQDPCGDDPLLCAGIHCACVDPTQQFDFELLQAKEEGTLYCDYGKCTVQKSGPQVINQVPLHQQSNGPTLPPYAIENIQNSNRPLGAMASQDVSCLFSTGLLFLAIYSVLKP